jgi:hypothetical protein
MRNVAKIFFFFMIVAGFIFPAQAQDMSWKQEIKRISPTEAGMMNGRRYVLEHNAIVEYLDLGESNVDIRNVFDFDNGLVYHENAKDRLAITAFGMISPDRISYIRLIGCYIANPDSGGKPYSNNDIYDFVKKYCVGNGD